MIVRTLVAGNASMWRVTVAELDLARWARMPIEIDMFMRLSQFSHQMVRRILVTSAASDSVPRRLTGERVAIQLAR